MSKKFKILCSLFIAAAFFFCASEGFAAKSSIFGRTPVKIKPPKPGKGGKGGKGGPSGAPAPAVIYLMGMGGVSLAAFMAGKNTAKNNNTRPRIS